MTTRLKEIFSVIPDCTVFADIGCDHGYIALEMLKESKCKKAIISDISAKCLEKAKELLKDYLKNGDCYAVVSNGFEKTPVCDCALIAGMGGEEIISILKNCKNLPKVLVLQPMKNQDKVRKYCVENGYKIAIDYTFKAEEKFYDLIKIEMGMDVLTEEEIEFGRSNIKEAGKAFKEKIQKQIESYKTYSLNKDLKEEKKEFFKKEIERLSKYV